VRTVQPDLLGMPARAPEGFEYRACFVSPGEEHELAEQFQALAFREFEFQGYRGKRRTVSFGLHYDFAQGELQDAPAMPAFLLRLRERAAQFAGLQPSQLPQVLVSEYRPGAAIGWHRDRPVFEDIVGISLLSPCRFRLRRQLGNRWERACVELEPRSAYLLRGPVRKDWEHSIPPADALRYSITFRSLRAPGSR
jgi:alkylated DNA repair dioxygenase AlkB